MFWLYFLALLPIIIGASLALLNKKVAWAEWGIGAAVALITAATFHFFAYRSLVGDNETWSGQIVQAQQYSAWKEWYEEAIYRTETYTTGSGKNKTTHTRRVFSHWESRTRWHEVHWGAESNINTSYNISKDKYIYIRDKFGGDKPIPGQRTTSEHNSRMIAGDPNDYLTTNQTEWIEPINKSVYFENRIKCTRNIFNFVKVTPNELKKLHSYLYSENGWQSNRLMGTAVNSFKQFDWEVINAYLGPTKYINLILIGWDTNDAGIAEKQIAAWVGGKKNDFIIQYGPGWSKVNSWCEDSLVKRNVETLFLNPTSPTILNDLKKEILANYKMVNWHKWDYLGIEPTANQFMWFIVILFVTQIIIYVIFHYTEF